MSFVALLFVVITVAAWYATFRATVDHPLDGMAILLYLTAYHFVFRPSVIALGLDSPYPDDIFLGRDVAQLVVGTHLLILVWFAGLVAGNRLLRPASLLLSLGVPRPPAAISLKRLIRISIVLTVLATLVTLPLWARFGGFEGLLQASKGERDVASRSLRVFPFIATITSAGAYLAAIRERHLGSRRSIAQFQVLALALVITNAFFSFSWGARDSAVFGLIAVALGRILYSTPISETAHNRVVAWWTRGGRARQLAVVLCVVLGVTFGLRLSRDVLINEEVASSIEDQSAVRQVAIATNNAYYDSLLLVVDDWPGKFAYRGGQDFWNAAVTAVPSFIATNPEADPPSILVARTYIPNRTNGWPVTPLGDWYLAFGPLGVLLGGVISGMLARAVQIRLADFAINPLSWAMLVIFMGTVFSLGFWVFSFTRYATFGIPMVALGFLLRLLSQPSKPQGVGLSTPQASARLSAYVPDQREKLLQRSSSDLKFQQATTRSNPGPGVAKHQITGSEAGLSSPPQVLPNERIRKDAVITIGTQVLGVVSAMAITVVAARTLSITEFAVVSWALSWVVLLSVFAGFGTPQSGVIVAARQGRSRIGALLPQFLVVGLVASVCVVAVWALLVGPIAARASDDVRLYRTAILAVSIWIPTAAFSALLGAVMRGLGWFGAAAPISEYLRRTILIALLAFSAVYSAHVNLGFVLISSALLEASIVACAGAWFWTRTRGAYHSARVIPESKSVFRLSSYFVLPMLVATSIPQSAIWISAFIDDSQAVALLSVAIRVSLIFYLPQMLGLRIFGPRIAASSARGNLADLEPMLRGFATIATASVVTLAAVFAVLGPSALTGILGSAFGDAFAMTMVFIGAAFVNSATGLAGAVLANSGHEQYTQKVSLVTIIAFLLLGVLLLPFGAMGWALSAALVMIGSNIATASQTRSRVGISTLPTFDLASIRRALPTTAR